MSGELIDRFGRRHNSLRISVTDRCNLRCTYCMPEEVTFQPQSHLLTFEEIGRFARVAAGLGVDKIRLTGGEPLMRRELSKMVAILTTLPGIRDIGLTTNGLLLPEYAKLLYEAGLRRINISLDTLDRDQFAAVTRRDELDRVLAGIEAAERAGFQRIKINAVAVKGMTNVAGMATFCRQRGYELRFIEFMPLEADNIWSKQGVLSSDEILRELAEAGMPAEPIRKADSSAPADEYQYLDGRGRLGIIASVTKPFCGDCNRIRLTADGRLRNCLFSLEEIDIKSVIRNGGSDEQIEELLKESVTGKWEGHQINTLHFIRPSRTMHSIGG